jgi:hypothetical protein
MCVVLDDERYRSSVGRAQSVDQGEYMWGRTMMEEVSGGIPIYGDVDKPVINMCGRQGIPSALRV